MIVKLLTEHHLEFLNLKGGCTGLSEPTIVKMPHCWKSHVTTHILSDEHHSGIGLKLSRFFHIDFELKKVLLPP